MPDNVADQQEEVALGVGPAGTYPAAGWRSYLGDFHQRCPGITEDVLKGSRNRGRSPYAWLVEALPPGGTVLDLACGSAPLWGLQRGRGWVGMDLSSAELGRASARGAAPLVLGDATRVPLARGVVQAVVCCMALMLVEPLADALDELARVLAREGTLVALLPCSGPLSPADLWRYGRLLIALRRRGLSYPNDGLMRDLGSELKRRGLDLVSDERARFEYRVETPEAGRSLVRSLYLPDEHADRLSAAVQLGEGWVGKQVGIPLRRVVARRQISDP